MYILNDSFFNKFNMQNKFKNKIPKLEIFKEIDLPCQRC